MTIELNERYFTKLDLANAVIEKLVEQGINCEIINTELLRLNGEKYSLKERPGGNIIPVQMAILYKI